jgi:hypothetical protein
MRAWTAHIFPAALILIGAVPVLYLAALFAWQLATSVQLGSWVPLPASLLFTDHSLLQAGKAAPVLAFIPDLSWAWRAGPDAPAPLMWILGKMHLAVLPALAGLLVAGHGVLSLLQQRALLRFYRQEHEDRLRRAQDYQRTMAPIDRIDGRREPFIATFRS